MPIAFDVYGVVCVPPNGCVGVPILAGLGLGGLVLPLQPAQSTMIRLCCFEKLSRIDGLAGLYACILTFFPRVNTSLALIRPRWELALGR